MFYREAERCNGKDHQTDHQPFDQTMGKTGQDLGDDDLGDRDRCHPVGFNRELYPPVKPEAPDTFIVGGIDGGHGDQAGRDEQAVGHTLHQADIALHADAEGQIDGQGIGHDCYHF